MNTDAKAAVRLLMLLLMSAAAGAGISFQAQYRTTPPMHTPRQLYQMNQLRIQHYGMRRMIEQRSGRAATVRRGNTAQPRPAPRSAGTRATSSSNRRASSGTTLFRPVAASIYPHQMAAQVTQNNAERRELETFLMDCLRNYEANMRRQRQPVKDVARAVSYFIGISYNVYSPHSTLTPSQGDALRAEIKETLEQDERFQSLSNRERQEMYETMAVMAEYVAISADVAAQKGNKQLGDMAREMAKSNLESLFGVPASQIRITDNGLEF